MRLVIRNASGTRVCDWEGFALLRDNAQHFLERGEPSARFCALHSIEPIVEAGAGHVDAARLRGEVLRAWCALWDIDLDDAAISLRTRAILTGVLELPDTRGTLPARAAGWSLPVRGAPQEPVPRGAGLFIQAVLDLTETAVDGDILQVRRAGSRTAARPGAGLGGPSQHVGSPS